MLNFHPNGAKFYVMPSNLFVGMIIAVVLVFLSLLLPILVGVGASDNSTQDFSEWTDGYFVGLAKSIVGEWLGVWMIAAGEPIKIFVLQCLWSL